MQETEETQVPPLRVSGYQEDTREEAQQSNPGFLPGESHDQRSLVGNSPKNQAWP